jgi:hypothetical protein
MGCSLLLYKEKFQAKTVVTFEINYIFQYICTYNKSN